MPKKKRPQNKPRKTQQVSRGLKYGYRSGLEDACAAQINAAGLEVKYETEKLSYVIPASKHSYTPDFKLPKKGGFFYVESKGRWVTDDRKKMLLIKEQHPEIDIRLVFSSCTQKLYKGSKTSYAAFCDKHGITYACKKIPCEWLRE